MYVPRAFRPVGGIVRLERSARHIHEIEDPAAPYSFVMLA